jgi:hypothetical protein
MVCTACALATPAYNRLEQCPAPSLQGNSYVQHAALSRLLHSLELNRRRTPRPACRWTSRGGRSSRSRRRAMCVPVVQGYQSAPSRTATIVPRI